MCGMNIMVTGGAGFIGSHLVDKLIEHGHTVAVVDNLSSGRKKNLNPKAGFYQIDICSPDISQVFKKVRPEALFHYAAQIDVRRSVENPLHDAEINVFGSLNILENCRKFGVKKIIFASSGGTIYGDANVLPTPETNKELPGSPYAIAKLMVEKYMSFYSKTYNMNYISLRYANVYGPRQNSKGEAGVVAIFADKLLANDIPEIFGTGEQTRDYIFIKDAVSAAIHSLSLNYSAIYNVGTGKETSVNEIYELVSKALGKKEKPQYGAARKVEVKKSCLDCGKIRQDLDWRPKYSLEEGIRKTVEYFRL